MSTDALPRYTRLQNANPLRPVDWRWQRAHSLVERGCYYVRRRDDEMTGRAVYFLRGLRRCTTPAQRARLQRDMPTLAEAFRITVHEPDLEVQLQARLLAGQDVRDIATAVQLPAAVIDTYEALFYHVRDRLQARSWMTVAAIGGPPGRNGSDTAPLLRTLAYYGGLPVLELVRPHLVGNADGRTADAATGEKVALFRQLLDPRVDSASAVKLLRALAPLRTDTGTAGSSLVEALRENLAGLAVDGGSASTESEAAAEPDGREAGDAVEVAA